MKSEVWTLQLFSGIVLWPVPSGKSCCWKMLCIRASTCRRGQHKQSVSIGLPRNTKPAHHSAALSLPSWTLIPCSQLYVLYNLSLFPSLCLALLIFYCPLKLDWIAEVMSSWVYRGEKSQVSFRQWLFQYFLLLFLPRLVKKHRQTVDKWPSVCLKTLATN